MGAGWRPGVASSLPATIAAEASTVTFVGIVVMQIANAFACRTERQSAFSVGFACNRLPLAGIVFDVLLTVAIVYTPIGQLMFGTAGVPVWWWLVCAAAIVPAFLAEEARKWLVRRRTALR
jgi:magnesium-transporting ATPase (P-type)